MSIKKLQKYVKKEWKVKLNDISKEETLGNLCERIAANKENCTREEVYNKTIDNISLPYWVMFDFVLTFNVNYSPDIKLEEIFN